MMTKTFEEGEEGRDGGGRGMYIEGRKEEGKEGEKEGGREGGQVGKTLWRHVESATLD